MNTKSSNKGLIAMLVGVTVGFLLMMIVLILGVAKTISYQKENNLKANCLDEFATMECFDKRIKGFQLRKELQLQLEAHKKNG